MRALFLGLCAVALLGAGGCHDAWQDGKLGTDRHGRIGATSPDVDEIASDPQILPQTYLAAGRLAESRGDLILAASMYSKAAALDQDCVDAHARLGLALVRMGRYKQAEEALLTAVELAPEKAYLRNNLAFAYLQQQRWPQAETALREALELQPTFARARVNLGMVLARTGQYPEAMEQFLQVLPPASAHYNLGLIHELNCRHDLAQASFTQALTLDPHMAPAREGLKRIASVVPPAQPSGVVAGVAQAQRGMALEHAIRAPAIVEAEPAAAVAPEPPPMSVPAVRPPPPEPVQDEAASGSGQADVGMTEANPASVEPGQPADKARPAAMVAEQEASPLVAERVSRAEPNPAAPQKTALVDERLPARPEQAVKTPEALDGTGAGPAQQDALDEARVLAPPGEPTGVETIACAVGPEAPDELLALLASSDQNSAPATEMAARLLRSAADWWTGEGGQGIRRRLNQLFSSGIELPETNQVAEGHSVRLDR